MALGAAMLLIEHLSGPAAQFPLVYAIPVSLAAWYSGMWTALALAIAVPLVRVAFLVGPLGRTEDLMALVLTTGFRGVVVVFMALWFARLAQLERDLDHRVKVLEGMLPICSFCKKIKNETGQWERLEAFISRRSEAEFSHGVCPSCGATHYPGILDDKERPNA